MKSTPVLVLATVLLTLMLADRLRQLPGVKMLPTF